MKEGDSGQDKQGKRILPAALDASSSSEKNNDPLTTHTVSSIRG